MGWDTPTMAWLAAQLGCPLCLKDWEGAHRSIENTNAELLNLGILVLQILRQ
jgi:hypothetical protein